MPVDPCFDVIVSDPRNTVRPPPDHVPLDKVRRVADAAMDQGDVPEMAQVRDELVSLQGRSIAIRHYRPNDDATLPVIVFCHGGGFVWGSIDTHDGLCRRLAAATGAAVVSVGYRLALETRYPGPVEDVLDVLCDIVARASDYDIDPNAIALCGDSAGGSICVSVAELASRARLETCHLALFYPALDPHCDTPSQQAFAQGPVLTMAAMKWFWDCYLGLERGRDREGSLINNDFLPNFPPVTIAAAEYDVLRDEAQEFHNRLIRAGVRSEFTIVPGMVHGYLSLPTNSAMIEESFRNVSRRLRAALFRSSKDEPVRGY